MSIFAEVDFRNETFDRTMSEAGQQDVMQAPPIVFVRGTGRCGSKTLANQLGLHPAIAKVPANQCLPEDLIDWSDDYLRPRCPNLTDTSIASACRAYFQTCCQSLIEQPGMMLHKSTMNVHRLSTLLELWPDAKIVYILRHPASVVPAYLSVDIVHYKGSYGYDATVANSLLRWANDSRPTNQLGLHPAIAKVPANQCLPEDLIDWSDDYLRPRCPNLTDTSIASACRAYFQTCCQSLIEQPGMMLHKSTMNVHRLSTLLELWPDAKIVYILRHPASVVPAYLSVDIVHYKGSYGYDATVANSLLRWANDVLAYSRSPAFGHPRVLQVRFEDMISDTDRFFAKIYRFLGVDDTFRHTLPGPVAYDNEFVLNSDERQWVIDSTADIVHTLGYDPSAYAAELPSDISGDINAHPNRRLGAKPPALDGVELVHRAMTEAAKQGWRRIGLFGALTQRRQVPVA